MHRHHTSRVLGSLLCHIFSNSVSISSCCTDPIATTRQAQWVSADRFFVMNIFSIAQCPLHARTRMPHMFMPLERSRKTPPGVASDGISGRVWGRTIEVSRRGQAGQRSCGRGGCNRTLTPLYGPRVLYQIPSFESSGSLLRHFFSFSRPCILRLTVIRLQ